MWISKNGYYKNERCALETEGFQIKVIRIILRVLMLVVLLYWLINKEFSMKVLSEVSYHTVDYVLEQEKTGLVILYCSHIHYHWEMTSIVKKIQ